MSKKITSKLQFLKHLLRFAKWRQKRGSFPKSISKHYYLVSYCKLNACIKLFLFQLLSAIQKAVTKNNTNKIGFIDKFKIILVLVRSVVVNVWK